VVGVHLVEVEDRPFLALVQEAAPGGDLGWQIEDCDFHMGKRGEATLVSVGMLDLDCEEVWLWSPGWCSGLVGGL
jgi:hypothetical protein